MAARGTLAAVALAAALLGGAARADQALLLTIAEYPQAPPLPGVRQDRESALRIAAGLGLADAQVRSVADAALDLAGLQRELADLAARTRPDERVFIYYSGHGTRRLVGDRCEAGLLAHDGRVLGASALAPALAALADKARELVVVIDACFSGGLTAVRGAASPWQPKFARPATEADRCETPSNFLPAVVPALRGAVNLERNQALLAAARDDELAFDHAQQGGLATTALRHCLEGGSAPATITALAACAQAEVDRRLPPDPRVRAQHITLGGNTQLALAAPTAADRLSRALAGADAGWRVTLAANTTALRIGEDDLVLTATSERDGYLTLLYAGSDGRSLETLYPGNAAAPRFVAAGVPFTVPRRWRARGPAGTNRIVAVVAPAPLSLAELPAQRGRYGAAAIEVTEGR